jgi:hypothetical protein
MDDQERLFVDRLSSQALTDNDTISCIEVLEVLSSVEALPALVRVMADAQRSYEVRERAAQAIRLLGPDCVQTELAALSRSRSKEVRKLIEIALGS